MKRVAIYARKSVYVEGSLSVENQINFCKEYINKKYKDATFMIFEDEGFSGSNTNRPEFIRLMKLIKLSKVDIVVCYKVDRIARNIVDFVNIYDEFSKNKVELISITEGFDPSTPIGKMLMLFLASFAEMERMNIAQRVRDNNLALAKRGKWSGGGAPIGYKQGHKTLEIENADAIKEIFKMKANRKNLSEILDYINLKYNNLISSKNRLVGLLRRPVYVKSSNLVNDYLLKKGYKVVGEADGVHSYLRYNDHESKNFYMCIAADVEGIVDDKTWLQVQKIADENITREGTSFSKKFWLTKTLRCPICGKTYLGQTKHLAGGTYEYYMCRDMNQGKYKTCSNTKRTKKQEVEEYVETYIEKLKNKDIFESVYSSAEEFNYDKEIEKFKKEINKLEKQADLLTEKITFASVKVSKRLMEQQDKILSKQEELISKKEELELKNSSTQNTKLNKDIAYKSICAFNKNLQCNEKRILVMNIFESIVYDPMINEYNVTFR